MSNTMYMLDTNICIYAIKNKNQKLISNIQLHLNHQIFISSLTVAELAFGVSNSRFPERNRLALLKFLSIFNYAYFDERDALSYGMIKTALRRSGKIIGPIDMLLAAQAVAKNFIFVTNNTKEFQRVAGLQLEDWSSESA